VEFSSAAFHDILNRLFENSNTGDGSPPPGGALPGPGARRDDDGMPTSRRQRSYDHRLIALVREKNSNIRFRSV